MNAADMMIKPSKEMTVQELAYETSLRLQQLAAGCEKSADKCETATVANDVATIKANWDKLVSEVEWLRHKVRELRHAARQFVCKSNKVDAAMQSAAASLNGTLPVAEAAIRTITTALQGLGASFQGIDDEREHGGRC